MIHLNDDGTFRFAVLDDSHLLEHTSYGDDMWDVTAAELRAFPSAEHAKFSLRLESDSGPSQVLFADEDLLRDLREAINVALGEG